MRRRLVAGGALLAGVFTGLALFRRMGGRRRDRVDLYYDDGSLVTLVEDEAAPLLDIARSALRAVPR